MSTLSQFSGGYGPIASVSNRDSDGGSTPAAMSAASGFGKVYASGALTATTLKTIVSVTGRGRLNLAGIYTGDTTSRTLTIKVTIDGVVVFNATSAAITVQFNGIFAVGYGTNANGAAFQPIDFAESMLIEIASSLSETDKVNTVVNYEVWA